MARSLFQRGAAGALVDVHCQVNGRDFQRSQTAVAVIAVLGHFRIASAGAGSPTAGAGRGKGGRGAGDRSHGSRQDHGPAGGGRPASGGHEGRTVQRPARRKVGRQELTGVGEIAGRRPKAGRDQGAVLALVRVGVLPLPDGITGAGRHPEIPGRGAVKGIFQSTCGNRKSRQQTAGGQQRDQAFLHYTYPRFLFL